MNNWIRIREDNTAEAFGPDASRLLLNQRKALDSLYRDWKRADKLNEAWFKAYGPSATQYVRNVYFLFDQEGHVRAAGHHAAHCEHYRKPGYVIVIRQSLEPCTCENNGDYCNSCEARQ